MEPNSGIETNLLNTARVEWGWIHQVTGEIKKQAEGIWEGNLAKSPCGSGHWL